MNAPTKFHPTTGEALRPIFVSKNGREYWPILGGSEQVPEPVVPTPSTVTIPVPPPAPAPEQTFTAEQIAKARQEEKDKLYPEIQSLKEKTAQFEAFKAGAEAQKQSEIDAAAKAAREEAEAEARKRFEESDAKSLLAEAETKWQSQFEQLQKERETEHALFEQERKFSALKDYANAKVNEALQANEVAPELADFVTGNTEEEIDASLEFVKQKTQQIVAGIQQAQTAARAAMPGVSTAGFAATGPLDTEPGHKTFTAEELANMPISEYAKHRSALLGAAASTQQNRGLYG